jgi:eukaryotic-like serine/threonine-protein kinase
LSDDCPDADVLAAFAEGRLSAADVGSLELHLSGCDTCPTLLGLLTDARPQLEAGENVDRYQVLARVGQGAFGTVYAAYDPKLDRRVALKIIGRTAPDTEARMLREARSMAKVSSPHVVAVYDVGTLDDCVFAVMDFVEGQTLRAWLAERPRSVPEVIDPFLQAGRGLAAAHAAGVIHRDFKPENVLVRTDGRVAVTDFGLARSGPAPELGPLDATGSRSAVAGTPQFMAPEVLRGEPADVRSDVYSFSVALYAALYGAPPFPGGSVEANQVPPSPPRGRPVPATVRDVVLAGLSADPALRPRSMHEVLKALEADTTRRRRALAGLGVAATAGVAAWLTLARGPVIEACRDRAPLWDEAGRAAVQSAWATTGHPNAADTWARVSPLLERYAAQWGELWAEACAAPVDDGSRARVGCLDERRHRFATLVEQLARVDRAGVDFAGAAAFALPSVEVCQGEVRSDVLPALGEPRSATASAALDRARTLGDLGRATEGLAELAPVLAEARGAGDRALEAEVLLTEGELRRGGDPNAALAPLHAAAAAASAAGRRDLEARAKVLLVQALSRTEVSADAVATELAYAEALVERLDEPALDAELLLARSTLNSWVRERPDLAVADAEAYLAATRALYGEAHPKVAEALDTLASTYLEVSREEEALRMQREALDLRVRLHGPDHPGSIAARGNLAFALWEVGRIPEALALVEENLARVARVLDPADAVAERVRSRAAAIYLDGTGRAVDALALVPPVAEIDDGRGGLIPRFGLMVMALVEVGGGAAVAEADRISAEVLRITTRNHDADQSQVWSAWELRGLALAASGRCAEALRFYDQAIDGIEHDPSDTFVASWARSLRAECLETLGRTAAAESDLRLALAESEDGNGPDSFWSADPAARLAVFLGRHGRWKEAAALAERALRVWPSDVGSTAAHIRYARGLALSGTDPAASRAEFLRARTALGRGLDQCRLGDDIRRALGETPEPRVFRKP